MVSGARAGVSDGSIILDGRSVVFGWLGRRRRSRVPTGEMLAVEIDHDGREQDDDCCGDDHCLGAHGSILCKYQLRLENRQAHKSGHSVNLRKIDLSQVGYGKLQATTAVKELAARTSQSRSKSSGSIFPRLTRMVRIVSGDTRK